MAKVLGTTITTKLENTIAVILGTVGIPFTIATYYDFRYPTATHMTIIAENNDNRDESFTVNLPGTFIYSERSWFIAEGGPIYLNGTELGSDYYDNNNNAQGTILQTQMPSNAPHTIRVNNGYGGLILIYRNQQ